MSLRKTSKAPATSVPPAAAVEYLQQFIADAHVLVAEGYCRLDPATLTANEEPDISGLIVTQGRKWLDAPDSPDWVRCYFMTEEKHEDGSVLLGMNRPRIDIAIERSDARPRPRFTFEAKRLYRSDSISLYVGPKGLGALLDGTYASATGAAGMLGYVQDKTVSDWAKKLEKKLSSERQTCGIKEDGPIWEERQLDPRLGVTRISRHRPTGHAPVHVYHSLLKCCA